MKPSIGKCEGRDIVIDVNRLMETRLLVTANSGAGKSWLLRRIFEQTYGRVQQIIIDPEGEFNTLREKYDYIICAPRDGDAIATPGTAKLLARRLLETEVSAVIDIYDLRPHERQEFVKLFCEALVNAPKSLWHPVLIGLDEAHVFCPEKGHAESAGSVIDLGARGRKRGFCLLAATQRLSKLNKDLAAELLNILTGRTNLDVDLKRAAEDLGFYQREQARTLKTLEPGEYYCYGPALSNDVIRVRVGGVQTTQPKTGQRITKAPPPPTEKIKKIIAAELQDLPKQAEQELQTFSDYKKEIANLRREITGLKKTGGVSDQDVRQRIADAVSKREQEQAGHAGQKYIHSLEQLDKHLAGAMEKLAAQLKGTRLRITDTIEAMKQDRHSQRKTGNMAVSIAPASRTAAVQGQPVYDPRPNNPPGDTAISSSQQKILNQLASLESYGVPVPHKSTLAAHSGFTPTSGGYANNLGRLRTLGYIDYPKGGYVCLTEAGRQMAAAAGPMDLDEYHKHWLSIVSSSQASILDALIKIYPAAIQKSELAAQLEFSPTSGGYANNLGRLRTLGAIEYPAPGQVKATRIVFPGDAIP